MTPPPLSNTLAELNDLCQFFINAENKLKSGQIVDMNGIDSRVANACKSVQEALPEQQKEYLPELTSLLSLLNSYETALRGLKASVDATQQQG